MIPQPISETLDWLIQIEDFSTARQLGMTVFRSLPNAESNAMATDFLASVLFRSKAYPQAAEAALKTLALLPQSPEALFNAAKCMNSAARPDEAERLMRRALELRPEWTDPRIDLAVYICAQGRLDEAMGILEEILPGLPHHDKNVDVVKFNLGWHKIRHGQFKGGMKYLGIGRKLKIWGAMSHQYPKPMLSSGVDLKGKTVLICGEGGAGDEMINARFGRVIRERGGRTIWVPQKPLLGLLSRTPGLDRVVPFEERMHERFDYWAPCMDLPRILELDLHQVPNEPYILPDKKHVAKWRRLLPPGAKLKVGLRWKGNALYEQDLMRSVPFALLERLSGIPGVELYSLQRDEGSEERSASSPVIDLAPELGTWEDTAAAISNLDLVISSCTSVPHLAAAMGKPTWLFCPMNAYYIWATPGDRPPWYPSIRLFRQVKFGTWDEPFVQVRDQLNQMAISRESRTHREVEFGMRL